MSKPQHSPLPWDVWKLAPDSDRQRRHIIVTADGEQEITSIVHNEADARHIVRCVNLHDGLVQALQQIAQYPANANSEPDMMGAALNAIASIAARVLGTVDALPRAEGLRKGRSPLPPDPERMNDKRAGWAGRAVTAFQDATGTDDEDVLSDLIADLMHWADRSNYDFEAAMLRARDHYEAETIGEEPSEPSGPIIIEVRGGVVQDVLNLPPGYEYKVKDYDDLEAEGEAADGRPA